MIPNDSYRRQTDLVSISELKLFSHSPIMYKRKYLDFDSNLERDQSDSQLLGELVHCLYLEPDAASKRYMKYKKPDLRTKVGKDEWATVKAETQAKNLKIVTEDQMSIATQINFELNKLFPIAHRDEFIIENEIMIRDPNLFCIPVKGKPDFYSINQNIVYDLKTTAAIPDVEEFSREILKRKYHWQCAFYIDLLKDKHNIREDLDFKFVVAQNEYPYGIDIFTMDKESIEIGRIEYRAALLDLMDCKTKNDWPKFIKKNNSVTVGVPEFYKYKYANRAGEIENGI